MDAQEIPITNFDALLRDLLYWDLVVPIEDPDGHGWQLVDRAAQRLDEFATESPSLPVERMVFFDHRCCVCGLRKMTRVHDAHYVCDTCWAETARTSVAERAMPVPAPRHEHHWTMISRRQQSA